MDIRYKLRLNDYFQVQAHGNSRAFTWRHKRPGEIIVTSGYMLLGSRQLFI